MRHTEKRQVHSYQKKKKKRVRKQTYRQLLQLSLCSDSCPMPSGREAQRGEGNAAEAFSLNFYAALLPSKVMNGPPRTNFLALTVSNSNPHAPKGEKRHKELLKGAGEGRKDLQKNSSLRSVTLMQKEGIMWAP